MKRLVIPSIIAALVLSGCAVQRAMQAEEAKSKLIGMSKFNFISCAGEPWEMRSYGSRETLLYINERHREQADSVPDKVMETVQNEIEGQYCEARVAITDGKVSGIRYSGQTGGTLTGGEICASIVKNCLPSN